MKEINYYIEEVMSGLQMEREEKEDFREELSSHLQEHISELMVEGYSEKEATHIAIQSFGNEKDLNRKMKTVLFPFYKVVRFIWNVVNMTVLFTAASYFASMAHHPQSYTSVPMDQVVMLILLIILLTGLAETFYETARSIYRFSWIVNPVVFFVGPSLLIGGIMSLNLISNPEHYQSGLWIELFAVPIGAFAYLISRQLFTLLFPGSSRNCMYKKAN